MPKILEFRDRDRHGDLKTVGKFEVRNQTNTTAELYIYGDIVSSKWMKWDDSDTCPADVAKFLQNLEDVSNLNIYINSGGGAVFAGLAIYHQLLRNKAYKTVYVDGVAASISSVIALCGDKVIIPSDAYMMIHKPAYGLWGSFNADDFRKMAGELDKFEEGIMNVYGQHLQDGVDIETIRQMVQEGTWMTGDEAAKYFDIEVGEASNAVACASQYFDTYAHVPDRLKHQKPAADPKDPGNSQIQDKEKLLLELDLI